ncbi:unnamed protein product [Nesidiocoris tenuis]|uniref:Uncharacterized protein n=1 Tax=Nesidiocoris tenuis TaxID=355587 RepID=A0A6H5GL46_9HEMI|nr:unnamed protein product [Nesidiocoris tenuis]
MVGKIDERWFDTKVENCENQRSVKKWPNKSSAVCVDFLCPAPGKDLPGCPRSIVRPLTLYLTRYTFFRLDPTLFYSCLSFLLFFHRLLFPRTRDPLAEMRFKINFEFKVNFEFQLNFEFKVNFEIDVNFEFKINFEIKLNSEIKVNFEFKLNFESKSTSRSMSTSSSKSTSRSNSTLRSKSTSSSKSSSRSKSTSRSNSTSSSKTTSRSNSTSSSKSTSRSKSTSSSSQLRVQTKLRDRSFRLLHRGESDLRRDGHGHRQFSNASGGARTRRVPFPKGRDFIRDRGRESSSWKGIFEPEPGSVMPVQ